MRLLPSRIPNGLMQRLWSLRRAMGLSPTQQLFRELERHGLSTCELNAVEVFAGTGFRHTIDYLGLVKHVEAWELEPSREAALRRNLPGATVLITDSFEEVRRTSRRFEIVMVDNALTTFGNGYVEHFDLFPDLFRIVTDSSVLVLNICPVVPEDERDDAPRMARRAEFYGTDRPSEIPIRRMVEAYSALMVQSGLALDWQFAIRRAYRRGIHYLALGMTRSSVPARRS